MFMIILWIVAIALAVVCIFESAKRKRAEESAEDLRERLSLEKRHVRDLVDEIRNGEIECAAQTGRIASLEKELAEYKAKSAKLEKDLDTAEQVGQGYYNGLKEVTEELERERNRADDAEQRLFRNWTMVSNDGRVRTYMRDCIFMSCDGDTIVPISDKENDRITAIVEDDEIAGYYRPEHETVELPEEAEVEAGKPNGDAVDLADFEDEE